MSMSRFGTVLARSVVSTAKTKVNPVRLLTTSDWLLAKDDGDKDKMDKHSKRSKEEVYEDYDHSWTTHQDGFTDSEAYVKAWRGEIGTDKEGESELKKTDDEQTEELVEKEREEMQRLKKIVKRMKKVGEELVGGKKDDD